MEKRKFNIGISASQLKKIALITMILDHMGLLLFPQTQIFRIIGRISFPIYAFLIAEGCRYTKNKYKYLLKIGITFILFQIVHFAIHKTISICVLFGFCLFVLFSILLDWAKSKNWNIRCFVVEIFAISVCLLLFWIKASYFAFTFLLPLVAYITKNEKMRLFFYMLALILMSAFCGKIQIFGVIACVPIALYNGEKGNGTYKNLFYVIYPLHYAILGIISFFI